jgi:hypothetical protein
MSRYPLRGGNASSLPIEPDWENQQAEKTHEHSKDTERLGSTSLLDPSCNKECPGERDDRTEKSDHQETVAAYSVVGVNELWNVSSRAKMSRGTSEIQHLRR